MSSFRIDVDFPAFISEYKTARKKFASFKNDLKTALEELEANPKVGDQIPGCGDDLFKIRIGVKGQLGKRGGYRLIYHVDWDRAVITPVALYFKPDTPDLPDSKIKERFGRVVEYLAEQEAQKSAEAQAEQPPS